MKATADGEKIRRYITCLANDFNAVKKENSRLLELIKNVFEWDYIEFIDKDEYPEDSISFIETLDQLFNYYKEVANGNKK